VGEHHLSGRTSYSQTGEDLLMAFLFEALLIPRPTYLDIGAYHPIDFNNTYYFYLQGACGINVEPNPSAISEFNHLRSRDRNFNVGIAAARGTMVYHEFDAPTLNTFSEKDAQAYQRLGHRLIRTIEVEVETVDDVLKAAGYDSFPQILNLDIEGMELPVLESMNLQQNGPVVICIETIEYAPRLGQGRKRHELNAFLEGRGYQTFADTHINTILVRRNAVDQARTT
jgi:FkbM family methyltransferase